MKCVINRENLLEGLSFAAGVVERRQSLPILANVLLQAKDNNLSLIGSDMEIELTTHQPLLELQEPGKITVSGRKLMDICRALPEGTQVVMHTLEGRLIITAGKSRFTLATLPAEEFPLVVNESITTPLSINQTDMLKLLEATYFAMAQQDVRYYLNGMLFEFAKGNFTTVATDGHRLAMRNIPFQEQITVQFIVPRKTVLELLRLLQKEENEALTLHYTNNSLRIESSRFIFVSRLIDGRFPDFHRVIPKKSDKIISVDRDGLRQMLQRAAILTSEKYRAVRVNIQPGLLTINASNMEQEEAHDELSIDYTGPQIEIGFNVNYLLDVLAVLPQGKVKILLTSAEASVLVESDEFANAAFVIMPMSL
jgi:DNA polymerase-3 subunit beta